MDLTRDELFGHRDPSVDTCLRFRSGQFPTTGRRTTSRINPSPRPPRMSRLVEDDGVRRGLWSVSRKEPSYLARLTVAADAWIQA